MRCEKCEKWFSAYVEGALASYEMVSMDDHFVACEVCRQNFEDFNAALVALDEITPVAPPQDLHSRITEHIAAHRSANPERIRWWRIDWSQVFSAPIPARAVFTGLALLLGFVTLANFAPVSSVTSSLISPKRSGTAIYGVEDHQTLNGWGPWGSQLASLNHAKNTSGLQVRVSAESVGANSSTYALRIDTASSKPVMVSLHQMPVGFQFESPELGPFPAKAFFSGYVGKTQSSVIRIKAEGAQRVVVTKISWNYAGKPYSEFIFVPVAFDWNAARRNLDFSVSNESLYDTLKRIASDYGVVLIASGDLGKTVTSAQVKSGTPNEALYSAAVGIGFKWSGVQPSIYRITPRS